MHTIKSDIIPKTAAFIDIDAPKKLDLKAICTFVATGFFLDKDTYWKDQQVLAPASEHIFDDKNKLIDSKPWFQWHYSPRDITFEQALNEFESLFEQIMLEQTKGKSVILPLSGGIDSRSQAVALQNHPNVHSYSYSFKNGYPENLIGQKIAKACGFEFESLEVSKGYLWSCIEDLATINQCYSDFTHPRQMAFTDNYKDMGDVFSLGHWGDVLFDSFDLPELSLDEQVGFILNKVVIKGGVELASTLWRSWDLEGDFKDYLSERIRNLLRIIQIDNTNAKLRAFKSMQWAPRWTSVNLAVFNNVYPITLPYYDNRMCEFICTIPEEYLKDRRLQIAYIQRKSKKLAGITWHEQKPFSLNSFQWNKSPYNLPFRIANKLKREFNGFIGKPHISRNWELQFLGKENDKQLKKWLFEAGLDSLVPNKITQDFYDNFKNKDAVHYSHSVSMLLTLALFNKKFNIK